MARCGSCRKNHGKIIDAAKCCGDLTDKDLDLKAKGLIKSKGKWVDPERPGEYR